MINKTFADCERANGLNYTPEAGDKWSLQEWYDSVRNIPVSQFTEGDLAKSCRQDTWIQEVVPFALEALKRNPTAGELYEGELLVALLCIPTDFWKMNEDLARVLKTLLETEQWDFDDDAQRAAIELQTRIH